MIDTSSPAQTAVEIDPQAIKTAERYIASIVARDPLYAALGPDWGEVEGARLLQAFLDKYAAVVTGDYARHGKDALRIALGAI